MACLCSLQLGALLTALPSISSTVGLVPPMPPSLVAALTGTVSAPTALASASMAATTAASAQLALTANLAAMASFAAAAQAAMGANAAAAMSASAQAGLQASLSASVQSLNASGPSLQIGLPALSAFLAAQANLTALLGVVAGARASFGIDLRAPGAVAALQAALAASASASGAAAASATGSFSAVAALMASMGFAVNAQGAASASAAASAISSLTLGVPPITANFGALSMLSAAMALRAAVMAALGVDLRAPNAMASLRVALSGLPLAALAQLQVSTAGAATASASAAAAGAANAAAALNLSGVASANLTAAGRLAVLMQLTNSASFLLAAPGACGPRCALAPAFAKA